MRKNILVAAMLLAFGLVPGCNGGGGPVQIENLCEEMQDALCGYFKRCDLEWYLQFATQRTCDQLFDCDDMEFDEMAKSVEAGRLAYDADLAGKCLQALRTADCANINAVFEDMPDECEHVFTGLVAQDGDCYRGDECAAGLYCDESISECPGQCQPYKAIGQPCEGGDCNPDLADCDWQQSVCVELAGVGEVCDYIDCERDLVCDYDSDPAVCLDPAPAGSSCTSSRGCEPGLQCVSGKCTAPAGPGQACELGEDGDNFMFACQPGYYCDADVVQQQTAGTCQSKKGSGAECILFYECNPGLLCIGLEINQQTQEVIPGSCGQPLKAGAACNAAFDFPECDWDLYCDEQTAVCTAYPGVGDPCVYGEDPECFGDELYCDSLEWGVPGVCSYKKPDGADCTSYEECLSDNCDVGGTGKCLPEERCIAP